jgi:hypothetical protein
MEVELAKLGQVVADTFTRLTALTEDHHKLLYGNGDDELKPGIKLRVDRMERWNAIRRKLFFAAVSAAATIIAAVIGLLI